MAKPSRCAKVFPLRDRRSDGQSQPCGGNARSGVAKAEPAFLRGVHVVVVDDNDDARDIVVSFLGYHGAHVTAAATAREALDVLGSVRPDVIVSDISMPGMTGHELIRQVRALPGEAEHPTPAIALTIFSSERAQALASGFQAYLVKPIDPSAVVREVARLAGVDAPPDGP
jgi:CheY-like chemotaxis protein